MSGVALGKTIFRRSLGRNAALSKVSVRPMFDFSCENIDVAYRTFRQYSKVLMAALESDAKVGNVFPRFPMRVQKSVAKVVDLVKPEHAEVAIGAEA